MSEVETEITDFFSLEKVIEDGAGGNHNKCNEYETVKKKENLRIKIKE